MQSVWSIWQVLRGGTPAGEVLSIILVQTWSPDHVFYYARPGVSPRANPKDRNF